MNEELRIGLLEEQVTALTIEQERTRFLIEELTRRTRFLREELSHKVDASAVVDGL